MIFRKKRKMIDVRQLQRRGVVRIPKNDAPIQTNKDGFVEVGNTKTNSGNAPISNTELFGFMDSTTKSESKKFLTEQDGYNKREVDAKLTELDNKIYRLENRLELVEKKVGVNQPSNSNVGVIGW